MSSEDFFKRFERLVDANGDDLATILRAAGVEPSSWPRTKGRPIPDGRLVLRLSMASGIPLEVLDDGSDPRVRDTLERFALFLRKIEVNRDAAAEIFKRGAPVLAGASHRSDQGLGGDQLFLGFLRDQGLDKLLTSQQGSGAH